MNNNWITVTPESTDLPKFEENNEVAFVLVARRGFPFPTIAVFHKAPKNPDLPWFDPVQKQWMKPHIDVTHWKELGAMPVQEPLPDEINPQQDEEIAVAPAKVIGMGKK